jgi:hypothetical protein
VADFLNLAEFLKKNKKNELFNGRTAAKCVGAWG